MSAEAIVIEAVDYASPMVVANSGFLQTLATVEQQVASLIITDAATAQQAADIQSRLTTAAKTLDTQRKALNKPFDDQIAAINAAAKGPAGRIEVAKQAVSKQLTQFAIAEQKRVAEENRKRQAELAALQEQQRKGQAERDSIAAELVTKATAEEDWGDPAPVVPTETERKIAAVAVPVVAAARPAGVTIRVTLNPVVENIDLLPAMFVEKSAKIRALTSTYCVKWSEDKPLPVCPGVRFEIVRSTVSTGR